MTAYIIRPFIAAKAIVIHRQFNDFSIDAPFTM